MSSVVLPRERRHRRSLAWLGARITCWALVLCALAGCSNGLATLELLRTDAKPLVLLPNSGRQGALLLVEAVISGLSSTSGTWYVSELPAGTGLRVIRYYSRSCSEIEGESVASLSSLSDTSSETSDVLDSENGLDDSVAPDAEHDTTEGTLEYHACFEVEIDSSAPLGVQLLRLKISNDSGERISGESAFYVVEPLD